MMATATLTCLPPGRPYLSSSFAVEFLTAALDDSAKFEVRCGIFSIYVYPFLASFQGDHSFYITAQRSPLQAVYALEFLTAAPQDNVKLALKGGMVPIFIDIIKSSAAEDRTRIRALSTLTDNSRAYYRFSGWVARLTL
jgi:hypothetical protein